MDRPLLSYLVTAYNQKDFIREAVESALAQTYSPLEIIISDDSSKDGTYEIVSRIVGEYRGPHVVRLNRTADNRGFGHHLNQAVKLCRGELIVIAAGDDVSFPERTEAIFQAWEQTGRKATSLFSSYIAFSEADPTGEIGGVRDGARGDSGKAHVLDGGLRAFLTTQRPAVNGCAHAWSHELFTYYGPLASDLEDLVLSFRTLGMGKMVYIDRPLLKYRRHDDNVSFLAEGDDSRSFEHREKRLRWVDEKTVQAYDNMMADIAVLHERGRIGAADRDELTDCARRVQSHYVNERRMMDGGLFQRWGTLARILLRGNLRGALRVSPRALPRPVYRFLCLFRHRWRAGRVPAAKNAPTVSSIQACTLP